MRARQSKPIFQSVVDLGLRDVGVRNDPRRIAAHFGKATVALFALMLVSVLALCVIVSQTGASAWIVVGFFPLWMAGLVLLIVQAVKRAPPMVVRMNAAGTNQVTWLIVAPFLLLVLQIAVAQELLLVPLLVPGLIISLLAWQRRGRVPQLLNRLRDQLAANETVLGDGIGLAQGVRSERDAPRVVVVTDRRVLVATLTRSTKPFLLVDAPHGHVSRFGIEWKYGGRIGVLSLTVAGLDGASETQVITSIAPMNLLSIARALQSHGVRPEDPAALTEAEVAWEEFQRADATPARLLDRAAMSTRDFDRGLWLLLGLSAVNLYLHPFGVGVGMLVVLAHLCILCGYVSGTTSSLAYIAPLNLLVAPIFFFTDADDVIALMIVVSAIAALGLWAGSALRGVRSRRRNAPAEGTAGPRCQTRRGSLRQAIGGLSLVRISGVLLATVMSLVVIATAAGFELSTLRLAVDEAVAKQVPVDGRSNLTGNAASLTYTPGSDLREFITDEHWDAGPNDGARWELRSSFTKGSNVISLAHYVFEPRLDDPAAVASFVADKDDEHAKIAGFRVKHTERVVDGRTGYVWTHRDGRGYWHYVVWFPQPVHTVRVECVARKQMDRFKRLCAEATRSLEFHY